MGRPARWLSVAKTTDRGPLRVDPVEARDAGRETVTDERGAPTVERAGEERLEVQVPRQGPAGDVELLVDEVVVVGEGEDGRGRGVEDDEPDALTLEAA